MKKTQLLIVLLGIAGVFVLYSFPKSIVKPSRPMSNSETNSTEKESTDAMKEQHQMNIPKDELVRLEKLKKSYKEASNKEKKRNFADSLIESYRRVYRFDSAAFVSEQKLEAETSELNYIKTGDLYIEAVNFASEKDRSGFMQKAQNYYSAVLKLNPKNLEAKSKLAMTYVGSETPMQAILLLREVLSSDPKNQMAIYNLGLLSIQSGQYDKAVGRFEELIKINPEHAAAHFYLGISRSSLGENEKAEKAFLKAKELDTDPEFRATVDSYLKNLKGSGKN